MKIIKKENGNIEILDNNGDIAHVITGGCCVTMTPKCQDDILQLFVGGQYINIPVGDVTATQVEPAAEIPFAGDIFALIALLSADFFFELAGGGGAYPVDYAVGFYTNFQKVSAGVGGNFVAPNYYYGAIVEILATVKISTVRVRIPTGVAGNGILALYEYDGTQWVLIDQTAPFSTAVSGVLALAWNTGTLTLNAGVYCFCTNTSSNNSFETLTNPGISNYFGNPAAMNAVSQSLQLHPSAYTGAALPNMPLNLSTAGFVPNILNLVTI